MGCNIVVAEDSLSIEVLVKSATFYKKFKSVSHFHRRLTNGWNKVGHVSNREWWKTNVLLGFYTYSIISGWMKIIYNIQLATLNRDKAYRSLRYRIHNQIISTINFLEPMATKNLIETYRERTTYQSFGHLFKSNYNEYQLQTR